LVWTWIGGYPGDAKLAVFFDIRNIGVVVNMQKLKAESRKLKEKTLLGHEVIGH
jgi:hypothetical protein